jgi:hypothetical protein
MGEFMSIPIKVSKGEFMTIPQGAQVTARAQGSGSVVVTIPKAIADMIGIGVGTKVIFKPYMGDSIILEKVK